ncbi:MAG: NUDIX hydrolase [Anaerolineales bacterium]|jgi:ADP-ribose pyrophosphatase YjhB (NUDIX family)
MKRKPEHDQNITPLWLEWAREIQAISQTGLHYAENDYQIQRYSRLLEISAQIISSFSDLEYRDLVRIFNHQIGYATPRIDVRGAAFQAGNLLMVKESLDGGWTMPGGWVDVGDTPSGAVEREMYEESGFVVKARKIIGVYDANRSGPLEVFHAFKIVFLCDILSGEARTSEETSDVKFFSRNELPETLSGERTKPRHLEDAFNALLDERPAYFD